MSFRFSQSLLSDKEFSSQENENSQDSGYAPGSQTLRDVSNPSMFPSRRALPRPPTWPTIVPQQPGVRRWKFASNNQTGSRDQFERDLKQHLQDLNLEVSKVVGKIRDLIRLSVNYLKSIYDKEVLSFDEKINEMKSGLSNIFKTLDSYDVDFSLIREKLAALELILSDVLFQIEGLNNRSVIMEEKLSRLVNKVRQDNKSLEQLIDESKVKGLIEIDKSSSKLRTTPRRLPTVKIGNSAMPCGMPRMMSRRNERCRIKTTINFSDSESD